MNHANAWVYSSNLSTSTNPSETTNGNGFRIADKDGNSWGSLAPRKTASGQQSIVLGTSRTIGSSSYGNNLYLHINSDGSKSVAFSSGDDATWRNALGINHISSNASQSSAISVPSSTDKTLCSCTLQPGVYVIVYSAQFANNSTGVRNIHLSESNNGAAVDYLCSQEVPAVNRALRISGAWLATYSTSKTIYLCAWQNSGSALEVSTGRIRVLSIHDV